MIGNNIWPQKFRDKLMHILPQSTYHGDAEIRGSRQALYRLGVELIKSAQGERPSGGSVTMMASDGEGYAVKIFPMSDQQMDSSPLPYAQLGQVEDFERCWNCPEQNETRT